MPRILAVVPARYASTRFPGKPLVEIGSRPMILRVCDTLRKVSSLDGFVVATDDSRIYEVVEKEGYQSVMTASDHNTGTDRIREVAEKIDSDLYLNVQGDEPFLDPEELNRFLTQYLDRGCPFEGATMATPITSQEEFENPNVVKVVMDLNDRAMYFSRAMIPYDRDDQFGLKNVFRHVGIYLYKKETLLEFAHMPDSFLEHREKLEQLRLLESGRNLFVFQTEMVSPGIDTPEDLKTAEEYLKSLESSR